MQAAPRVRLPKSLFYCEVVGEVGENVRYGWWWGDVVIGRGGVKTKGFA